MMVAALTIYESAYLGEIVRAGLLALPAGQAEAARSLGLGRWATLRKVLLPQASGVLVYVLMALILLWKPDGLFKAG